MYELHTAGKRKKKFKNLLAKLSNEMRDELRSILETNPLPYSLAE
jgi:hypothetical protein